MIRTGNYTQVATFYESSVVKRQSEKVKNKNVQETDKNQQTVKSSESKLSQRAQEYLEKLRAENGDYDFIVADAGDDFKGLFKQSTKEFSVVFSTAELERMATDEKYAQEKMNCVQTAVEMSIKICEEYGFERNAANGMSQGEFINKVAISFKEDGSMSIYAELEKVSERQQARIERQRESRAEDKKEAAEKKAEEKKEAEKAEDKSLVRPEYMSVKKTVIKATSEEELLKKIGELDWSKIAEDRKTTGTRIDFFA